MSADADTSLRAPDGDDWLACASDALDPGTASTWVVRPDTGAAVTFTGTARDHAGDRSDVHLLEYEAYTEQVVPVLERVAAQARQMFGPLGRIALWHRTGALAVTEPAVVVAVSSAHRTEAFDAARWAIEEIKATAPIWKREHWADGNEDWGHVNEPVVQS